MTATPGPDTVWAMEVPPVEDFDSRPTDTRPPGRVYRVKGSTRLVCYAIEDTTTLSAALPEGSSGLYLFAFFERGRIGHWNWTWSFEDVARCMASYRGAMRSDGRRPAGPDGDSADLSPISEFRFTRGGRQLPRRTDDPRILSLDDLLEPLTGGGEADVHPIDGDQEVDSDGSG